uniref:F-box associated beta-propeller type 3 domain-containing protein n=1 Tax=Arundo donax TaxID=35708 RepID=A0A0A9ABS8_ARUDO
MYQDILVLDHRAADPAAQLMPVARLSDASLGVDASCVGLLILSIFYEYFFVWNPVTREKAPLRVICGFWFLGFYPHRPTGEYRLLLSRERTLMDEDLIPGARDTCYIFALGCDLSRCIGWPLSERPPCSDTPVLVRSCLHWTPVQHQSGGGMITVFDTTAESFRRMRAPIVPNRDYRSRVDPCLFEMDGTLGMYNCNDGELRCVDIWVLQDYKREVWKLRCKVELPMAEIRLKFDGCEHWSVMAAPEEGNVLVLVHGDRWLLHVDTKGKPRASFHRDGQALKASRHMIRQSLVRHDFFPKLAGYVSNASSII